MARELALSLGGGSGKVFCKQNRALCIVRASKGRCWCLVTNTQTGAAKKEGIPLPKDSVLKKDYLVIGESKWTLLKQFKKSTVF